MKHAHEGYSRFDKHRAEYVRVLGKRIGELRLDTGGFRRLGRNVSSDDIKRIKDGFPKMKWEKLLSLGLLLGIDAIVIPLEGPIPCVPSPAARPRVSPALAVRGSRPRASTR